MDEIMEFLKECKTSFVATCGGDQLCAATGFSMIYNGSL